jgi:hypothetical protein
MVTKIPNLFVFWGGKGQIIPHLLFEYFSREGIGLYFPDDLNHKNSEPILVLIKGNIVVPINVGFLLDITKKYILESTQDQGEAGPILDSLHKSTSLFSDRNLRLLPTLRLEFNTDTLESAFFPFRNGVINIGKDNIQFLNYEDIDQYFWGKSIIPIDFCPVDIDKLQQESDFMKFLIDLTSVEDAEQSAARFDSLASAIGYLLHRYKDPATTKAVILMDIYVNGQPNGGSGKTLLINSIGKLRNLSIIDGKSWDSKEWFALSSVDLNSELLLFDDVNKNFDFEKIFPMMSTGMHVRQKYKNNVFIPFERSPKVALTTNYAINGTSSSNRRRMHEFEVSGTFSADYSPRDKYNRNFFDDWLPEDWNHFYNTMFCCLQVFLKNGLMVSEPINLSLTKLINKSCEEFPDWAENRLGLDIQHDKKKLYDNFVKAYPEYSGRLKQREMTSWLRAWADYKKLKVTEGHSGEIRYIIYLENQKS